MSEPYNEAGGDAPLRVGLIADAEELPGLAAVARRPGMTLVAQAGMPQVEALPDAPWFDDTRILITQAGVQALLLATSLRVGVELARAAISQGTHVWRAGPLGRGFAEATEVVTAARETAAVYRVASWWEHIAGDVRWAVRLTEGFKPVLSTLRISLPGPEVKSWRASANDAGGGALMSGAHALLEALVAMRKLPESVFAVLGKCRRKSGAAPRETEDVAAAILRYESGGIAIVEATWDVPPYEQYLLHHGAEATVVLDEHRVAVRLADGKTLDERAIVAPAAALDLELARFEAQIRGSDAGERVEAARERQVAAAALMEAIYLSARTGQPEVPRKFYAAQGWPEPAS